MTVSSFHKRFLSSIKLNFACGLSLHQIKMSVRLPTFSKAKVSYQEFTKGLETFLFEDLSDSTEIGRGTFGSVLTRLLKISKNQQRKTLLLRNYCRRQGPMRNRNFLKKLGFLTVLATRTSQVLKKYVSSRQQ